MDKEAAESGVWMPGWKRDQSFHGKYFCGIICSSWSLHVYRMKDAQFAFHLQTICPISRIKQNISK